MKRLKLSLSFFHIREFLHKLCCHRRKFSRQEYVARRGRIEFDIPSRNHCNRLDETGKKVMTCLMYDSEAHLDCLVFSDQPKLDAKGRPVRLFACRQRFGE
jgi:hypothetical protein